MTKTVINDNGGTALASDFSITVAGTAVAGGTTSFPGSAAGTTISLDAGTYTVSETGPSGYTDQPTRRLLGPFVQRRQRLPARSPTTTTHRA